MCDECISKQIVVDPSGCYDNGYILLFTLVITRQHAIAVRYIVMDTKCTRRMRNNIRQEAGFRIWRLIKQIQKKYTQTELFC